MRPSTASSSVTPRNHRWHHTGTSTERGYGAEWRKLREHVMRRDKRLCQVCMRSGKLTPATEVDHITPKAKGGEDDERNLQAICTHCHAAKTAREASPGQRLSRDDGWRP